MWDNVILVSALVVVAACWVGTRYAGGRRARKEMSRASAPDLDGVKRLRERLRRESKAN